MGLSLLDRVKAHVSSSIDNDTLLGFIKDGLTELLRLQGNASLTALFATTTEHTSFPITVDENTVLAVEIDNSGARIPCRYVPFTKFWEIQNPSHPLYPTSDDPAYTIIGNELHIYPEPTKAYITTLSISDITDDEYIDKLPLELTVAVTWYAIAQAKYYEAKERESAIFSDITDIASQLTDYISERPTVSAPAVPTLDTITS